MIPREVNELREFITHQKKKNLQDLIEDATQLLDEYDIKQNDANSNGVVFSNEVNISFMEDALLLLACIVDKYDENQIKKDI